MLRSAKALKRNNWESKGMLIGPSMAPRYSGDHDSVIAFPRTAREVLSASAQILRRGWQTGNPNKAEFGPQVQTHQYEFRMIDLANSGGRDGLHGGFMLV